MDSSNNLVLLVLLTIALFLVSEAAHERRTMPSEEEKKELERQLKAINKPAIKSFKTEHGDIFDCIEIHKQLAFDHYLLKNHSVQLKPTTVPEWITGNNISGRFGHMQERINCPDGTVIVKRTTMQDLMNAKRLKSMGFDGPRHFITERNNTSSNGQFYFATVDFGPRIFSGLNGSLNLWEPHVLEDQVSIAFMSVGAGSKETFASISVGWMVNPTLYQSNNVHLYGAWTVHGSQRGCYGMTCPGFVQVSKTKPLGAILQPVSIYNRTQYDLHLSLYQDLAKRDWWFASGGENVGYWPASLFKATSFSNRASYGCWGGQTYTPNPMTKKPPVMGSGHWPSEGYSKAAYVNNIKVIDNRGRVIDPPKDLLKTRESSPNCYKAIYVFQDKEPWLRAVYYGGPAGCVGA